MGPFASTITAKVDPPWTLRVASVFNDPCTTAPAQQCVSFDASGAAQELYIYTTEKDPPIRNVAIFTPGSCP
jgi:hypothetical protein